MHSLLAESTNILITKAYLPDIDKPAVSQIFDKACTNTLIRNTDKKMTKSRFEIISNSLDECNSRICQLLFKSINTFKLRPGLKFYTEFNYLKNFIQNDNISPMQEGIKNIPNELFVSFVEYMNQPKIEFKSNEPTFTLTHEAIGDLNSITDFDTAFKFLDAYGYSYPLTSYETNQYNITVIRVTSYNVLDPLVLENIARSFFLQNKRKSDKKIFHRNDSEFGILRFEVITIETPQIFKCNNQVRWIPLPKLISTCTNSSLVIKRSAIKFLTDCWLIRDTSYLLINKIFSNQILSSQIVDSKNFNFEIYWFDSFIQSVYLNYKKFLLENFYLKNNFSFDFNDDRVINFLHNLVKRADFEIKILELISSKEFLIFTEDSKVPLNCMLLYYSQEWIKNDPDTYLTLLASIKSIISLFYNKPTCILVDYDHFGSEKKLKSFYLEYQLLDYPNVKLNRNKDKVIINAKNQMRFDCENLMHLVTARKNSLKLKNNLILLISHFTFPKIIREKLVEIDLSKNCLLSIESDSFDGMINLEKLNLSQNSLSYVKPIFKKLKNLKYLNLSLNKISYIHMYAFDDLENLISLNLSNNYLKNLPNLGQLAKLKELNLGSNMLKSIDGEFENLKNLKSLFLCFNSIEYLNNCSLINQKKIEFLFLNSNKLKKIHPKIFLQMKNLKILFLCGNENILNEDIENLKFSNQNFERIMFVYRNEQYRYVIKYFDKMYKYFGFDVQALRIIQKDNFSDSMSSLDCYELDEFTSRL